MLVLLTKNVTFQNKYILSQVSVTAACLTIFILVKTTCGVLTSANTSAATMVLVFFLPVVVAIIVYCTSSNI